MQVTMLLRPLIRSFQSDRKPDFQYRCIVAVDESMKGPFMPESRRKASPPSTAQILKKMREICLVLPEAVETETWGQPHFRVNDKIFAGCGEEGGESLLGFKLEKVRAALVVLRPGFRPSKYGGHAGWVSVQTESIADWDEIADMVHESYRLIAPKRLSKQVLCVDDNQKESPALKKKSAKKAVKRSKPS